MNAHSHHGLHFEALESRRLLAVEVYFTGSGEHSDLTTMNLTDVAMVDICGCGDNDVMLDAKWVAESGVDGTVKVVADSGDDIKFKDTGWKFAAAKAEGEQIVRQFKNKDAVLNLVGPDDFTNPVDKTDVNGSGDVTMVDVLLLINELGARRFSDPEDATTGDPAKMPLSQFKFYDVSANHKVTSLDALIVINQLTAESSTASALASVAADTMLPLQVLASDPVIARQVSTTETSSGLDRTDLTPELMESDGGLANDVAAPRIQNGQQQPANSTEQASSMDESLVDSVMLDATVESCLERQLCLV